MTYTAEQFIANSKAHAHTLESLTTRVYAGFEKLVELNLSTSKMVLAESFSHAQAALAAKDVQELLALKTGLFQSLADKSAAYGQHVLALSTSMGTEFSQVYESMLTESKTAIKDIVENIEKNAPAGTETAVAAFKTAVSASQDLIDSAQHSAKKAVKVAETKLKEATTSHAEEVTTVTPKMR